MGDKDLEITGETKVATLLEHFPEIEETLIAMAPPFRKLRNPILRRSVAKVTSLRQAAAVGRLPVDTMVNALRSAVGQAPVESEETVESVNYFGLQPEWFDESRVVASADEAKDFSDEQMPIVTVLKRGNSLKSGEIFELRTSFLAVPGIDIMRAKGFLTWSVERSEGDIRTYFTKPGE